MNGELRTLTTLFGYGEDALTLWAVTEKIDLILRQLNDPEPEFCTVFYRPSFGRDQYGEFDAIIFTAGKAYLVESKWDGSGDTSIKLEEHQIRRHEIFGWYHDNWKGEVGEDWDEFARLNNPAFKEKFTYFVGEKEKRVEKSKYIPSSDTILGQNLQTVLTLIIDKDLEDVLLYMHRGKPIDIDTDFKIVKIEYETTYGNYIELLSTRGRGSKVPTTGKET